MQSDIRRVLEQARRNINYVPFHDHHEPDGEKWPVIIRMVEELKRIGYPPTLLRKTGKTPEKSASEADVRSFQSMLLQRMQQAGMRVASTR